ncbi:MAG: helix-turn-helix domain-containing protein [Patescibacteria group bacterium]|nr:helix-turn-helix domain-containing protein [Patescibacteria group bacterium]
MSIVLKAVGYNLKKYRKLRNLSQGELSRLLNIHRSYISGLENGTRNPSISTLDKIAQVLRVDLTKIVACFPTQKYNWAEIYKERDAYLFPFYLYARPWGCRIKEIMGYNLNPIVLIFSDKGVEFYADKEKYVELGKVIFEKFLSESFYKNFCRKVEYYFRQVEKKSSELEKINQAKLTSGQLLKEIENLTSLIEELNKWGQLVSIMEYGPNNILTEGLIEILKKANKKYKLERNIVEDSSILSSPLSPTFLGRQKKELLEITEKIKLNPELEDVFAKKEAGAIREKLAKDKRYKEIFRQIEKHRERYSWVNYGYKGPAWNLENFIEEIKTLLEKYSLLELKKEIKNRQDYFELLTEKQKDLEKQYRLDQYWRKRFKIVREQTFWKELRKEIAFYAFFVIESLHQEIARRLFISTDDLHYLLPAEYKKLEKDKRRW